MMKFFSPFLYCQINHKMHPNLGLGIGRHELGFSLGSSYLCSSLPLVLGLALGSGLVLVVGLALGPGLPLSLAISLDSCLSS